MFTATLPDKSQLQMRVTDAKKLRVAEVGTYNPHITTWEIRIEGKPVAVVTRVARYNSSRYNDFEYLWTLLMHDTDAAGIESKPINSLAQAVRRVIQFELFGSGACNNCVVAK